MTTRHLALLVLATLVAAPSTHAQRSKREKRRVNPVFAPVLDDPKLPRVLLIGDSISIGYTLDTRALLKGKANVHRIPTNGGPTTKGLKEIDTWLGPGQWDVIHFNWGLHDLKYTTPGGKLTSPENGHQQVPLKQYRKNLNRLVRRLKRTRATLIWRNTTPVPPGSRGRIVGDSARYNAAAAKVMQRLDVPTQDLFTFASEHMKELMRPANVHFTREGSAELAARVAAAIERALAKRTPRPVVPPRRGKSERIILFDGEDLSGWRGNRELWSVRDGVIIGANEAPVKVSTYLLTEHTFTDFRLVANVRLVRSEMHSGIAFWGRNAPEHGDPFTYAGHLVMFPSNWGLYDLFGRNGLPVNNTLAKRIGVQHGWNQLEILARGNRIRVVVNGALVMDWRDPSPDRIRAGPIGLQLHANKAPQEVHFKDLVLNTFPSDRLTTMK